MNQVRVSEFPLTEVDADDPLLVVESDPRAELLEGIDLPWIRAGGGCRKQEHQNRKSPAPVWRQGLVVAICSVDHKTAPQLTCSVESLCEMVVPPVVLYQYQFVPPPPNSWSSARNVMLPGSFKVGRRSAMRVA